MAFLEAHGLRKRYGATVALDGIDLSVEEGRILGLIGPNGAGKTTALNAILGLIPFEGELRVLGAESVDPARCADARGLLYCRCGDFAALDEGFAGAGLCGRRASAL